MITYNGKVKKEGKVKMAEFCLDCFLKYMLTTSELEDYKQGILRVELTKGIDFCEGCCSVTNVVESVAEVSAD